MSGGRPRTAMTDEAIEAILRTVRLGMYPDRAAQIHGVSSSSLRSFRASNEAFRTALEKAEAEAEGAFLSKMIRHTEKQWTAVAWMLERRWPERWAKRDIDLKDSVQDLATKLRDFMKAVRAQDTAEGEESDDNHNGA